MGIEKVLRTLRRHFQSDGAGGVTVNLPAGHAWDPAPDRAALESAAQARHVASEAVPGR